MEKFKIIDHEERRLTSRKPKRNVLVRSTETFDRVFEGPDGILLFVGYEICYKLDIGNVLFKPTGSDVYDQYLIGSGYCDGKTGKFNNIVETADRTRLGVVDYNGKWLTLSIGKNVVPDSPTDGFKVLGCDKTCVMAKSITPKTLTILFKPTPGFT